VWKRLPVEATFPVPIPGGGDFLYRADAGDGLARRLYWRGLLYWEYESIAPFRRLVQRARTFVDVGAYTGVYTLLACATNPAVDVYAFEPVARIYQRLVANVLLNRFHSRCHLLPVAVSDASGVSLFFDPGGTTPSTGRLVEAAKQVGRTDGLVPVQTRALDDVIPLDVPVDLVKIDTEATEDRILAGMRRHLASSRPSLMMECLPEGRLDTIESSLRSYGYSFLHLRGSGPTLVDSLVADPSRIFRNYLCVADPKLVGELSAHPAH
jgi:FkbM family methyltransferase